MQKISLTLLILILLISSCQNKKSKELIEDRKMGFIDAGINDDNVNLKRKARYSEETPGNGATIDRAFENAPPMIPHSTKGFFPIKIGNNICLSCHLPEKAKKTGAREIPKTHFMSLRPKMKEVDGIMVFEEEKEMVKTELKELNNSYFNCSLCHAPQADVTIDIENLFTPEFREEFGIEKSSLNTRIDEGIKNK